MAINPRQAALLIVTKIKVETKPIRQDCNKRILGSTRTEHIKGNRRWLPMCIKNLSRFHWSIQFPGYQFNVLCFIYLNILNDVAHTEYKNHESIEYWYKQWSLLLYCSFDISFLKYIIAFVWLCNLPCDPFELHKFGY